jgi:hypothetical protein
LIGAVSGAQSFEELSCDPAVQERWDSRCNDPEARPVILVSDERAPRSIRVMAFGLLVTNQDGNIAVRERSLPVFVLKRADELPRHPVSEVLSNMQRVFVVLTSSVNA